MKSEQVARKGALEIVLQGKLDIDEADAFEQFFTQKVLKREEKNIGINLQKIDYVDSSGLGVLIKVLNVAKNAGKQVEFFGASPKISNIFKLARLDKFFTFTTAVEFYNKYPSAEDEELDKFIDSL